jgi:hypothetical protein
MLIIVKPLTTNLNLSGFWQQSRNQLARTWAADQGKAREAGRRSAPGPEEKVRSAALPVATKETAHG